MSHCPLCERSFSLAGAYLASADYVGQWFTFPICVTCRIRQARLPKLVRLRQDVMAANKVIKHPEKYEVSAWPSREEAKLFARLSADLKRQQIGSGTKKMQASSG